MWQRDDGSRAETLTHEAFLNEWGPRGRLQLTVELVDRAPRTLIARRRFEAAAPTPQEDARGG